MALIHREEQSRRFESSTSDCLELTRSRRCIGSVRVDIANGCIAFACGTKQFPSEALGIRRLEPENRSKYASLVPAFRMHGTEAIISKFCDIHDRLSASWQFHSRMSVADARLQHGPSRAKNTPGRRILIAKLTSLEFASQAGFSQLISHGMPNWSTRTPKRCAQNVSFSGI